LGGRSHPPCQRPIVRHNNCTLHLIFDIIKSNLVCY
jgi:hypothetical protein